MQRDYELEMAAEALGSRLNTEFKPRAAWLPFDLPRPYQPARLSSILP
jgi:hypothetical protein